MRMRMRYTIVLAFSLVALAAPRAHAQDVWVAGAVQHDVQRFTAGELPNRLDGSGVGWTALAALRLFTHLTLSVEWSDTPSIEDVRQTTLEVNARSTVVTSSVAHTTRSVGGLAGFTHAASSRVQLSYRAGLAFTRVQREFFSDAAGIVLVRPSNDTTPVTSVVRDRFTAAIAGIDARVRTFRQLHFVGGVRAQKLDLSPELRGWSLRTIAGAGWVFD
jgi:hypothetical protein